MSEEILVDGKAARACDSCIGKRARWYCAADDAFLCQSCDATVHSANSLARRHERVPLKVASNEEFEDVYVPSWLQGFKRKARSPRKHPGKVFKSGETGRGLSVPVVPELGSGDTSQEDNEDEQLLYRVPVYDPFDSENRTSSNAEEPAAPINAAYDADSKEVKALLAGFGQDADYLDGILPSEEDLAEFAADVESLLGGGIDGEGHGFEGLGMTWHSTLEVKLEEGEANGDADMAFQAGRSDVDLTGESFEMNFNYASPGTCGDEAEKVGIAKKRKTSLKLDYDSVILAWSSQRSPWTNGCRPEFRADEKCWPEIGHDQKVYTEIGGRVMSHQAMGGREARVTRYREKRRTRLFSKKIRYEVRKLNAEKRPRMKGRFVKRASLFRVGEAGSAENVTVPLLNM